MYLKSSGSSMLNIDLYLWSNNKNTFVNEWKSAYAQIVWIYWLQSIYLIISKKEREKNFLMKFIKLLSATATQEENWCEKKQTLTHTHRIFSNNFIRLFHDELKRKMRRENDRVFPLCTLRNVCVGEFSLFFARSPSSIHI